MRGSSAGNGTYENGVGVKLISGKKTAFKREVLEEKKALLANQYRRGCTKCGDQKGR